jgi:hypothetical protein
LRPLCIARRAFGNKETCRFARRNGTFCKLLEYRRFALRFDSVLQPGSLYCKLASVADVDAFGQACGLRSH